MNGEEIQAEGSSVTVGGVTIITGGSPDTEETGTLIWTDPDTNTEIAVIQVDPAGTNSTVQLYGWRDGTFMIRDTVSLSAGIVSNGIQNVAANGPCISPANWPTGATRWMW